MNETMWQLLKSESEHSCGSGVLREEHRHLKQHNCKCEGEENTNLTKWQLLHN